MSEEATLDEFVESSDPESKKLERRESRFWGKIPERWELVDGSDVYDVNPNPKPNTEPNTYIEMDALDTELPWPKYFGKRNASEYSGKTFTTGDTLLARITPCTENGKAAFVPEMETAVGIGSTEYAVLSPKTERIQPWFLYYLGRSYPVHNYAVSRMRGSTGRQRIPFSVFRRELDVALPPLPEQRKIATVLHTVDRAIEQTNEIIEQIKRLKLGVSQHYFEDYDTVRREENPESVDMVELSELVEFKPGKAWKTDSLSEEGLRIIRISNLTGEKEDYWWYNGDYEQRRIIEDGDLLFSWAGMRSSIGVHLYRGEKALLNQHIYNLEPKSVVERKYLYYYLDYRMSDLHSLSQGGAVQIHLTKDIIENILVPKVDSEERESIVFHLSEIDNALQNEICQKNQLRRLKRGLQQDLLSGTVRTTNTNIEVPDEIAQHG